MRCGAILCLVIFAGWMTLALLQLWLQVFSGAVFFKLTLTACGLIITAVIIMAVLQYLKTSRRQREGGFLD